MNRNEVALSVLIDYYKALDTIDHRILLEKLQNMKNTIKIICSYLIERYQYLQIKDKRSTLLPMFFDVPQGSILGLALFNLYIAELANRPIFPQPSSTPMTPLSIDIARSQSFMNVQLQSKEMWKSCSLGHNKTI